MNSLSKSITRLREKFQERKIKRNRVIEYVPGQSPAHARLSDVTTKLAKSQNKDPLSLLQYSKSFGRLRNPRMGLSYNSAVMSPRVRMIISPTRIRTYKLDAVALLDSRVKQFIWKHFRMWKKCAMGGEEPMRHRRRTAKSLGVTVSEKESDFFRVQKKGSVIKMMGVKRSLGSLREVVGKWAGLSENQCGGDSKNISGFISLLSKYTEGAVETESRERVILGWHRIKDFVTNKGVLAKGIANIEAAAKRGFWQILKTQKGPRNTELDNIVFTDNLARLINARTRVFFCKYRQIQKYSGIYSQMRTSNVAKGIKQVLRSIKYRKYQAFTKWAHRIKKKQCKLPVLIGRVVSRQLVAYHNVFWLKMCAQIASKRSALRLFTQISKRNMLRTLLKFKENSRLH